MALVDPSKSPRAVGWCTGCRGGGVARSHAIHIAAITQIRHPHSEGRTFYDRKVAEGKTKKEAVRALKRRISDAMYRRLLEDQTGR